MFRTTRLANESCETCGLESVAGIEIYAGTAYTDGARMRVPTEYRFTWLVVCEHLKEEIPEVGSYDGDQIE
jgi:hypothetical protein